MFLAPLLREPAARWMLVNVETGSPLAGRVQAAVESSSRRRGLLGRTRFEDEALIIAPCHAVHTAFMRFPIDVLVTNRDGVIRRCIPGVRPWRVTGSWWGFATIELPTGTIGRTGTRRGQRVELRRRDDP
jgi:hypothetical protein